MVAFVHILETTSAKTVACKLSCGKIQNIGNPGDSEEKI